MDVRVGVLGGGLMGSGVAEVCARAGARVHVVVTRPASLASGRRRVAESMATAVHHGKLTADDRAAALRRIAFTTNLTDVRDCHLVIESVTEDVDLKTGLLRELDGLLERPEAILASNTSSLCIAELAAATARPGRFVGTHFFNPVPVMPLVEVVTLDRTDDDVYPWIESFLAKDLGKTVLHAPDRPGFVVNSLLVPFVLSAIRLVSSGCVSPEDIDRGMVLGCAHPMGPLRLADFVGLDTLASIARRLHAQSADPALAPPPLLLAMVADGRLGEKSGQGFYTYG